MPRSAVSKFLRVIDTVDRSKRRTEVFSDFCELSYCAVAKPVSPWAEQRNALEAQYMQVVARYRDKDDVRKMPELLALTAGAVNGGGIDYLGEVAGELGALDAGMGQFFTPYDVSRMMAEINLTDAPAHIEANGFITVQEPAAGACGMVLAVADVIEAQGFSVDRHIWVESTELSRATYHMGYVQKALRGVAGRMICGNSLSGDIFTHAYTPTAPHFIAASGHPFAKQRAEAAEVAKNAAEKDAREAKDRDRRRAELPDSKPTTGAVQLGLFD